MGNSEDLSVKNTIMLYILQYNFVSADGFFVKKKHILHLSEKI